MKLQANVTKQRGDKTYTTYRVTLPRAEVEDLGWQGGDDLTVTRDGDALVLTKAKD